MSLNQILIKKFVNSIPRQGFNRKSITNIFPKKLVEYKSC